MAAAKDHERRTLNAELYRLAERTENLARYIEVIERRLDALRERTKDQSVTVITIDEPIAPLRGGVSLKFNQPDEETPPYHGRQAGGRPVGEHRGDHSWWPLPYGAETALVPSAGWRNYTLHKRNAKVLGISVCGVERSVLEATVSAIADQQDRLRDFIPVFLTDSTEFDVFRRYGFVWEYFPGSTERARYSGTTSWAEYGAARRALVARKWQLDRVICIGPVEFGVVGLQTENHGS